MAEILQGIIPSSEFKTPNVYKVSVSIDSCNTSGNAGYSTIFLNEKLLFEIIQTVCSDLESYLKFQNCIVDGFVDLAKWRQLCIESCYKIDSRCLNRIVSTLIHELVHIKQHSMQENPLGINSIDKNYRLEYRSYLVDRKKFIAVIKNLNAGIKNDETDIIHASSPQEIPARAHSFVLKYISTIVDVNPLTLQPTESHINMINSWINKIDPKINDPKYKFFNEPYSKKYKIYKRYMKTIYKEVISYKEFLINIRNVL